VSEVGEGDTFVVDNDGRGRRKDSQLGAIFILNIILEPSLKERQRGRGGEKRQYTKVLVDGDDFDGLFNTSSGLQGGNHSKSTA